MTDDVSASSANRVAVLARTVSAIPAPIACLPTTSEIERPAIKSALPLRLCAPIIPVINPAASACAFVIANSVTLGLG